MPLNSRDHEEIGNTPFKIPPYTGFIVYFLKFVCRIPWIKRRLNNTVGGLNGRIINYEELGEFNEAAEMAFYALEKYRNKKEGRAALMNHHHWWAFMQHAVYSIEKSGNSEQMEKAIEYGREGVEPFKGYDVARSFVAYSRWKYRLQEFESAVEYASVASKADGTWGYPEFLLGWYALVSGSGNAVKHLKEAIKRDPRIIFTVSNDSICKTRPDIRNKLKALAVSEGIVTSSIDGFESIE